MTHFHGTNWVAENTNYLHEPLKANSLRLYKLVILTTLFFVQKPIKFQKSNLGTGRVATTGGRPTQSCRTQSFNRIC